MTDEKFPDLKLPKRYEALKNEADKQGIDISKIVQIVDDAVSRIDKLLRQVRDGGIGRFELFLGKSGSGKTTFFKTLNDFYQGIRVREVGNAINLNDITNYIKEKTLEDDTYPTIWVMCDRDNPRLKDEDVRGFFEDLRVFFRENKGNILIVWPITDEESAQSMAKIAWSIGRDSVVDVHKKGVYNFTGISKEHYYEIADVTIKNINPEQNLETFGLTKSVVQQLVEKADTIAEFFSYLEEKSVEINERYQEILQDKKIPRVWILVAGDSIRDLNLTVANLTQGIDKNVDIDRIISYLDQPDTETAYVKEWQSRREQVAFIMRKLDVRIFELTPNATLTAIRLFGDGNIKQPLNLKTYEFNKGIEAFTNTYFMKPLLGSSVRLTWQG